MFWEHAKKVPLEVRLSLTDDILVLIYRYMYTFLLFECLLVCYLSFSAVPNCLKFVGIVHSLIIPEIVSRNLTK